MRKKTGDTLVEVTIAIGIFSMVAVTVVTLVNNSTSRVQTALETTLAREEIDVQAETIRFIQSAYLNGLKAHQANVIGNYKDIWHKIVDNAHSAEYLEEKDFLAYRPHTCDELYTKDSLTTQKAFIVNPTWFNAKTGSGNDLDSDTIIEKTVTIATEENYSIFQPTTTYPHIVYSDDDIGRYDGTMTTQSVEGIYVIAVKGEDSLAAAQKVVPYYDFYIRTCWYGLGAKLPSTISTVIRLVNPEYLAPPTT